MLTEAQNIAATAVAENPRYSRFKPLVSKAIKSWLTLANPGPFDVGIKHDGGNPYTLVGEGCACLLGAALIGEMPPVGGGGVYDAAASVYGLTDNEISGLVTGFDAKGRKDFDDFEANLALSCGIDIGAAIFRSFKDLQ